MWLVQGSLGYIVANHSAHVNRCAGGCGGEAKRAFAAMMPGP
jgi:hypothetical protein